MEYKVEYIEALIEAYKGDCKWVTGEPLEDAKKLFKIIKKDEKVRKDFVPKDQEPELYWAKYDLKRLGENYMKLTKNQIYLKHQSVMINNIYLALRGE